MYLQLSFSEAFHLKFGLVDTNLLFRLFLVFSNLTPLLEQDNRWDDEHRHVDSESKHQEYKARVPNVELGYRVLNEQREAHHMIHNDYQLDLIERVHLLVKLVNPSTDVAVRNQNRNRGEEEKTSLDPELVLTDHHAENK